MKVKISNIIMFALLLLIVAGGILYAGQIRGWFDAKDASEWILTDIRGTVTLKRDGVAYTITENSGIRNGDTVICGDTATVVLKSGNSEIYINSGSELIIDDMNDEGLSLEINKGEVFSLSERPLTLIFGDESIEIDDSVVSLSVRVGAQTLNVYSGKAESADSSQRVDWVDGESSVGWIAVNDLNDFNLDCLMKAMQTREICFSEAELTSVLELRAGEVNTVADPQTQCSVTIVCDTILDNIDELDPAKAEFVPKDGVILPSLAVDVNEGDTVFDILGRVCEEKGIQLEYSWTPMYDSYYIEGINNLYEFDCGYESGWMYKVNGWFPNYGCSDYSIKPGDSIVWCYTCKGLGDDVGDTSF